LLFEKRCDIFNFFEVSFSGSLWAA